MRPEIYLPEIYLPVDIVSINYYTLCLTINRNISSFDHLLRLLELLEVYMMKK